MGQWPQPPRSILQSFTRLILDWPKRIQWTLKNSLTKTTLTPLLQPPMWSTALLVAEEDQMSNQLLVLCHLPLAIQPQRHQQGQDLSPRIIYPGISINSLE